MTTPETYLHDTGTSDRHFTSEPPNVNALPRACVSYAWKAEKEDSKERHQNVQIFCDTLKAHQVTILRDITDTKYGERISEFTDLIGRQVRIYVFLSDYYLKSPYCMYELNLAWRLCGYDKKKFTNIIRAHQDPRIDISKAAVRLNYVSYWIEQHKELNQLCSEVGISAVGGKTHFELKLMNDFIHSVDDMLGEISDILMPQKLEDFITHAIVELLKRPEEIS